MSLTGILRFVFSFRLLAAVLLLWFLISSQSMAWQQPGYNQYSGYAAPVNYNPYARPQNNPSVGRIDNFSQRNYNQGFVNPAFNYPQYNYPRYNPSPYYNQPNYYAPRYQLIKPVEPIRQDNVSRKLKAKPQSGKIINSTKLSKQSFIDKLLPYIEQENKRLKRLRNQTLNIVQQLNSNKIISDKAKAWIKRLAKKFRVKGSPVDSKQVREELLTRVDIIPSSLTLAQAATESAWGKSRFATEANNLFGIWTYDESKGLKPKHRDSEKKHLVRIFDHYGESVAYYMHTLNSHSAYKKLREIRKQQRNDQSPINGLEMAKGLYKYSAKGDVYIQLIRTLIRQNEWAQLDTLNLPA